MHRVRAKQAAWSAWATCTVLDNSSSSASIVRQTVAMRAREVILASAVAILLTALSASSALAMCAPARTGDSANHLDTWRRPCTSGFTGVNSNIREYRPYTAPNGFSTAWTMLFSCDGTVWGQVGWMQADSASYFWSVCAGARCVFTETVNKNTSTQVDHGFPSLNQPQDASTQYTTGYQAGLGGCGVYNYYMNGPSLIDQVGLCGTSPGMAQVGGEVKNQASQMAGAAAGSSCPQYFGTPYCHTWVDFAQYTINNGSWTDFNADGQATHYDPDNYWGWSNPWDPSHHVDVWDPTCTSG